MVKAVATDRAGAALGLPDWNPALPDWVESWRLSEDQRVWPPEI